VVIKKNSDENWRWGCQPYAPAALYLQEDSWYSFLLEAESTPGPLCSWKGLHGVIFQKIEFFITTVVRTSNPVRVHPTYFIIIIIIIIIIVSGVRLSPLGTAANTGLLYQPQMIGDGDCGAIGGMKTGRGNRRTQRKPTPAPLRPPQIPHDQTRARTRAAAVGSQRLTAWAMARPFIQLTIRPIAVLCNTSLKFRFQKRREFCWPSERLFTSQEVFAGAQLRVHFRTHDPVCACASSTISGRVRSSGMISYALLSTQMASLASWASNILQVCNTHATTSKAQTQCLWWEELLSFVSSGSEIEQSNIVISFQFTAGAHWSYSSLLPVNQIRV
jgi:hypothetical protein